MAAANECSQQTGSFKGDGYKGERYVSRTSNKNTRNLYAWWYI